MWRLWTRVISSSSKPPLPYSFSPRYQLEANASSKVDALIKAIRELKIDLGPVDTSFDRYITLHDGQVHDPLGAGSYYFQRAFVRSTIQNLGLLLLNNTSNQDLLGHTLPPTTVVIDWSPTE
jgi:hypothetical protein